MTTSLNSTDVPLNNKPTRLHAVYCFTAGDIKSKACGGDQGMLTSDSTLIGDHQGRPVAVNLGPFDGVD